MAALDATSPGPDGPGETPSPGPAPGRLNENQERRVLATFGHVDNLLKHVEALCHEDPSPFARERPDITAEETRLLLSFVGLARQRMLAAVDRLGLPRPEQILSARRSVSTSLLYAEIALSEIEGRGLRGYGAVDPHASEEITALSADLQDLMRRGTALLREHDEGGLVEQVSAVPGPSGQILRKLLEVSTRRGLTELRPLLGAAAERAVSTTLDVGVFGRVSSGKSSLINALVEEAVLPVGATPVTAVPLRITRGPHEVQVRFADGHVENVGLERLPEFATEEHNPQNRRGVRSIEAKVPGAPPGLRFLDTPGVGSLVSAGAAQAFAWLPRCDLGLVLVAAGSPVGRDEIALVSGLRHAGIDCWALLSKSDLLGSDEQQRARDYISGEFTRLFGGQDGLVVRAVSTRPGFTAELEQLRGEVLVSLASRHTERAARALRIRLQQLIALTASSAEGLPQRGEASVDFEKNRAIANDTVERATEVLRRSSSSLLEEVSTAVSSAWAAGEDGATHARTAILTAVSRALAAVREAVDRLRAEAGDGADADGRRLPPLFDPEFLDALKTLPPPRFTPGFARHAAARRAVAPLLPFLEDALRRYAERLRAWGEGAVRTVRPIPGSRAPIRDPELAALEALLPQVEAAASPSSVVEGPRGDAR